MAVEPFTPTPSPDQLDSSGSTTAAAPAMWPAIAFGLIGAHIQAGKAERLGLPTRRHYQTALITGLVCVAVYVALIFGIYALAMLAGGGDVTFTGVWHAARSLLLYLAVIAAAVGFGMWADRPLDVKAGLRPSSR